MYFTCSLIALEFYFTYLFILQSRNMTTQSLPVTPDRLLSLFRIFFSTYTLTVEQSPCSDSLYVTIQDHGIMVRLSTHDCCGISDSLTHYWGNDTLSGYLSFLKGIKCDLDNNIYKQVHDIYWYLEAVPFRFIRLYYKRKSSKEYPLYVSIRPRTHKQCNEMRTAIQQGNRLINMSSSDNFIQDMWKKQLKDLLLRR